jgi:hypothetical protein
MKPAATKSKLTMLLKRRHLQGVNILKQGGVNMEPEKISAWEDVRGKLSSGKLSGRPPPKDSIRPHEEEDEEEEERKKKVCSESVFVTIF